MPDNKDKFADIQEMLDYFDKKYSAISRDSAKNFKAMQLEAVQEAADAEERNKKYLTEKVLEMRAEGLLASEEAASKYAMKMIEEQQKLKLESEIGILKEISKEEEARRARELKLLEKEKDLQKNKNEGNTHEAKKLQKEIELEKRKNADIDRREKLKEEGASYQFGDELKEVFNPLKTIKDEIAKGNVLKRTADHVLANSLKAMGKAITEGLNAINTSISSYAKYQTAINTRLQGTRGESVVNIFGSLVDKLDDVAFSPLISAADLYTNLNSLVGQGIVTNVEQRAFFETVKGGIATTFDATSESLNRMIRLQRNDSTAARLGMEGYLTRFLNTYVENTEYLQSTFDTVASSLFEASAALGGLPGKGTAASLEFEYVVQKWLGTLTGVGLSNETAQSIATALGQLGSGNVDVLNSQMGTLLTMSASTIGQNIGDILNKGLDADTTNKLLTSMVEYLQTIAGEGTNVTKAELAKVFGVSISDLVAVAQMDQSAINTINNDLLTYGGMYTELRDQFNKLPSRMGISNILENLFGNLTYQTGMNIAGNPASYALWKITDLIQGVTGGIPIPFISALGTGADPNTTVENLMKIALVGVNTLGSIGGIVNGLSSIGKGEVLLDKLGVKEGTGEIKKFGAGLSLTQGNFRTSGLETSQLVYVGQEDSSAFSDSALNKNRSDAQKQMDKEIKKQQENDPTMMLIDYLKEDVSLKDNIAKITADATNTYEILNRINSNDGALAAAIAAVNTTLKGDVLTAIKNNSYVSWGDTNYDKTSVMPMFASENTLINTATTSISTVNAPSPVLDYFNTINFEEGFASIVQSLLEINTKMSTSGNLLSGPLAGFTQ